MNDAPPKRTRSKTNQPMTSTPHEPTAEEINHTGNAPLIPRREVVAILNQVQQLQTSLLILLNRYEPDHFAGKQDEKETPVAPV